MPGNPKLLAEVRFVLSAFAEMGAIKNIKVITLIPNLLLFFYLPEHQLVYFLSLWG